MNDAQARRLGYRNAAAVEQQLARQASEAALARRMGAEAGADRYKTATRLFDERLDARIDELKALHPPRVPTNAEIDASVVQTKAIRARAKPTASAATKPGRRPHPISPSFIAGIQRELEAINDRQRRRARGGPPTMAAGSGARHFSAIIG